MKLKQRHTINIMAFHRKLVLQLAIFGFIIALLAGITG